MTLVINYNIVIKQTQEQLQNTKIDNDNDSNNYLIMMDSMATTQIYFVQLYAVFVTICLVVSAVATQKKKTTNAIKKAMNSNHYSANPNDLFSSDMNAEKLYVSILIIIIII